MHCFECFKNKKLRRVLQSDDEQLSENRLSCAQSDRLLMLVVESENWVKRISSQPLEKQENDGNRETQIIKAFCVCPCTTNTVNYILNLLVFLLLLSLSIGKKTHLSPHFCPHPHL